MCYFFFYRARFGLSNPYALIFLLIICINDVNITFISIMHIIIIKNHDRKFGFTLTSFGSNKKKTHFNFMKKLQNNKKFAWPNFENFYIYEDI